LESVGDVIYTDHPSRVELGRLVKDVDAVFPNTKTLLDEAILGGATRLKLVCTPSTGTDHIDETYCRARGIEVMSLKTDLHVLDTITSTAEHAFGLTLNVVRNMPWSFDHVRTGGWDYTLFRGRELQGRTVGIVGYGRLGRMYSRYAGAFKMKVLAYDPFVTISDPDVKQVELGKLLSKSEIITIHVHLNDKTRLMINKSWFDLMNAVYFINTSRGCLVNEWDLIAALNSGHVKAAGLDVICGEIDGDTSTHPLVEYARSHSNLMITPHCGGMSLDGQEKAFTHAAQKLADFFSPSRGLGLSEIQRV
jgi:D-3-phosphoglycerate dehydrogenase